MNAGWCVTCSRSYGTWLALYVSCITVVGVTLGSCDRRYNVGFKEDRNGNLGRERVLRSWSSATLR